MAERPSPSRTPEDIQKRTYRFALRVIKLARAMPRDVAGSVLGRQVLRSGTRIGANCEEAKAAQSRADFVSKLSLSLKEARETLYWMRLVRDAELVRPTRVANLVAESDEIVSILTSIVRKTKSRA